MTVNVGDKVKDLVTGLEGIAIARTVWLNGCVRIVVQPQEHKDGKPVEGATFDEPQLTVLQRRAIVPEPEHTPEPKAVEQPVRLTGGPRPSAVSQPVARR